VLLPDRWKLRRRGTTEPALLPLPQHAPLVLDGSPPDHPFRPVGGNVFARTIFGTIYLDRGPLRQGGDEIWFRPKSSAVLCSIAIRRITEVGAMLLMLLRPR
jgi:hypothetical protein